MACSFAYDLSTHIPAPTDAVWAILADYSRDPEWRNGVAMRSEPCGPVQDGMRTFEELRLLGKLHRNTARIDSVRPGRSFRFVGEDGHFEGSRSIEAANGGSRVRVTLRVAVPGGPALAGPLLGLIFRRRVRRDLIRLRALLTAAKMSQIASAAA